MIQSKSFYSEYHGHKIGELDIIHEELKKQNPQRHIIYLAGDSSLDNKFWFDETASAINGYENILEPPISKQDIAYWMNKELYDRKLGEQYVVINCAIEESSIGERSCCRLLPQDKFIQNRINEDDIAIISVGGNDIALKINLCTVFNLLCLHCFTTTSCLENCTIGQPFSCDDYCMGCTTGFASNFIAFLFGYGYFLHLFQTKITAYIKHITKSKKPKFIMVCMLYFLDEKSGGSWADTTLGFLNYNTHPEKVQMLLRRLFIQATSQIHVPGIKIIPVPLFEVLNGKNTSDYVQRVEPSASGGQKMGKFLVDLLEREVNAYSSSSSYYNEQMSRRA